MAKDAVETYLKDVGEISKGRKDREEFLRERLVDRPSLSTIVDRLI